MEIDKYIDPELLADNASFTVTEEVRHDFTEEEIIDLKGKYFTMSNFQDIREEALKEFKAIMTSDYDSADIVEIIWLESVDLKELMELERRRIMTQEIEKLEGLTIIYQ